MASIMVLVTVLTILFTSFRISQATSRTVTSHEPSIVDKHEQWMARFSRVYRDELEKQMRRVVFKKNLKFIENFNKKDNKSYELGVNEFADWTNEEFLATHTGLKGLTAISSSKAVDKTMSSRSWNVSVVAGESKDWRNEGAVTPVKYQGQCGNAFIKFCLTIYKFCFKLYILSNTSFDNFKRKFEIQKKKLFIKFAFVIFKNFKTLVDNNVKMFFCFSYKCNAN